MPGKFHGQRSLRSYSPWSSKALDTTEHAHKHNIICVLTNELCHEFSITISWKTPLSENLRISCTLPIYPPQFPLNSWNPLIIYRGCNFAFSKLLINFWLCGVFIAARLFSSCGDWGLLSSCDMWTSHSCDFSSCRACALGCMGFSSWAFWALEHKLNSCGALA